MGGSSKAQVKFLGGWCPMSSSKRDWLKTLALIGLNLLGTASFFTCGHDHLSRGEGK